MFDWLLIFVMVAPNGGPSLVVDAMASKEICETRAQEMHAMVPMAPAIFKCVFLPSVIGEQV